jgi:hypothetical protein
VSFGARFLVHVWVHPRREVSTIHIPIWDVVTVRTTNTKMKRVYFNELWKDLGVYR